MPRRGELFSAGDVLARMMMTDTGVGRSDEAYAEVIEGILPIRRTFEITSVPDSEVAPPEIRQQWVGLSLPVRTEIASSEPIVHVLAVDGLNALVRAGRHEARTWWGDYYDRAPHRLLPGILNPFAARHHAMAARICFLGFNSAEGVLSEVTATSKRFWQRSSNTHENH